MKKWGIALTVIAAVAAVGTTRAFALQKIQANAFKPSMACLCHQRLIGQWQDSMHAKALSDPLYRAKRDEALKATDGALAPFCDSCHGPVATMAGEDAGALDKISTSSRQAVFCDFCHQVKGTNKKLGNASYIVDPSGTKRAQLKDPESYMHPTAYSEFHTKAEFCGMCHNVDHPVNGMHLEATYTEWKNSPYAKSGIVCQDCHMTPGPGIKKPNPGQAASGAPKREHLYDMTFIGANVALGDAKRATQNLKSAAKLELILPKDVKAGTTVKAGATITNVGAGHYLPTGLTEVRRMWLEVKATDANGNTVLSARRDFVTELKDAKGNHPVELWDAVGIHRDDRIPPMKSVASTYEFTMPEDKPVTVRATLYYRSVPEELAEKAGVEVPTTTMAAAEKTVGEAAPGANVAGALGSTTVVIIILVLALIVGAGGAWMVTARRKR